MNDIRTDPEVLRVYWAMKGQDPYIHRSDVGWQIQMKELRCEKCYGLLEEACKAPCLYPDPITMSVCDLAEYMRNQCVKQQQDGEYRKQLLLMSPWPDDHKDWVISRSTPEHRIRAACKAWDKQLTGNPSEKMV